MQAKLEGSSRNRSVFERISNKMSERVRWGHTLFLKLDQADWPPCDPNQRKKLDLSKKFELRPKLFVDHDAAGFKRFFSPLKSLIPFNLFVHIHFIINFTFYI